MEFQNPGTGDKIALNSVKWFLDYFAHFLSDQACIYMCFGGIYLTSSVIDAFSFMFENEDFKKTFLDTFINSRGKGMSNYIKKVPLNLIKAEGDLASRGCILYAVQNGMLD